MNYRKFYPLFILLVTSSTASSQNSTDIAADQLIDRACQVNRNDCGKCIQTAHCTWCRNQTNPESRESRCRSLRVNEQLCMEGFIENPQNGQITDDEPFTTIENPDEADIANLTVIQLKPQKLILLLRKDVPYKVNLDFQRVVDYPVDLYYVMDLSYSMGDDLETLQNLGASLVDGVKNLTKNVRLGFGTFVDKVMLPFASTIPEQLADPCYDIENANCAPAFGFRHQLSVTSDGSAFREAVNATRVSGNLDSPEGGFDALMQIAVCEKAIAWRRVAFRVILLTTDASPHLAMDGKLASILEINDMQCHLQKGVHPHLPEATLYSRSKTMDYPSIGQLKKAFLDNKIQTIFAVTKEVFPLYQPLGNLLENSFVDQLNSDSSNIINVISTSYNVLRKRIQLTQPQLPNNVRAKYRVWCPSATSWIENSWECSDASIGDNVTFQMEITLTSCPADMRTEDTIQILSTTISDIVDVTLAYICECDCAEDIVMNSSTCGFNGDLQCGLCNCNPGREGRECQCIANSSGVSLDARCTDVKLFIPGVSELCRSHGRCECGVCDCDDGYYNTYCQCRKSGCAENDNGLCGGPTQGVCVNCNDRPVCECNETAGWSRSYRTGLCICNDNLCRFNSTRQLCENRGNCTCNYCSCNAFYDGIYCQTCIHPDCVPFPGTCASTELRECAECVYQNERLNEIVSEKCKGVCEDKNINFQSVPSLPNCASCSNGIQSFDCAICNRFSNDEGLHQPQDCTSNPFSNCVMKYRVAWDRLQKKYTVLVQRFVASDCPEIDPLLIVLPIVGGILLIGIIALIVWKIIQTIRAKIEYERFLLESKKAKWETNENELYVQPSNKVINPMFAEE